MIHEEERRVEIVEVAPRDGFQSIDAPLPTREKIEIIEALIAAGLGRIEIGSFVSPKAVPQMADMPEIADHLRGRQGVRLAALVPNAKGAELALRHHVSELVYVLSVSDSHNRMNVRRSVGDSLEQLRIVATAVSGERSSRLRVDLATAFDCPFAGTVPLDDLRRVFHAAHDAAPLAEFALCDTTGRADPFTIQQRFEMLMTEAPDTGGWAFHGHDTFGMGVANALFAFKAGVRVLDSAAAGLGGCPFAPGASGNTATEDLCFAFQRGRIESGIDIESLLQAADRIAALPAATTGGHLRTLRRERVLSA